jgi:hypothetical protein
MVPYEIMESYGIMDDNFDNYFRDFNYEVAEGSETST